MSLKSFKTSYDNISLNKGIKLSNLKLNFASLSFSIVAIEPDCYQRIPQKFNYIQNREFVKIVFRQKMNFKSSGTFLFALRSSV